MKKVFIAIIILSLAFVGYALYKWVNTQRQSQLVQQANISNFEATKNYLIKHFKWNYPIPTGDLILLDKTKTMIHLSDRNVSLNEIPNLYVIQGTTCDILKDNNEFQKVAYDKNNSLSKLKRCFTYSVTSDRKNFQIWTIIKKDWTYVAKLDGTINSSITRSYDSPRLVQNWSEVDLPYPSKLSPVVVIHNLWKSKIFAEILNTKNYDKKKIVLQDWINYLLSSPGEYNIKIYWNVYPTTNVKFVDVVWDIVNLRWNNAWQLNFTVKWYKIFWNKKDYIADAGKFLAEILKLSPSSDMTVKHWWTTLVIRWTKFTVQADSENFDTFLSLGHIVQLLEWKKIDLTMEKAFSLIKGTKIVQDLQKVKQLASFTVFYDVLNNPKWSYSIAYNQLNSTDILSGVKSIKKYGINYENWQKIKLIVIWLDNDTKKFDKMLEKNKNKFGLLETYKEIEQQHGKWKDRIYKNLIDNICSANSAKGLDISKIWYLLDIDKSQFGKLTLKSDILQQLNLTKPNYIILTSRHYNWQNSQVLGYNPNDSLWIRTISLPGLNYDDKISKVIVACEEK